MRTVWFDVARNPAPRLLGYDNRNRNGQIGRLDSRTGSRSPSKQGDSVQIGADQNTIFYGRKAAVSSGTTGMIKTDSACQLYLTRADRLLLFIIGEVTEER